MGEERERLLAGRVEQALGAELGAQPLELLELVAEADMAHRRDGEAEVAGLDEVVGLDARDDVVADREIGRAGAAGARPDAHRDRGVGGEVLDAAEHVAPRTVPGGDLAFDPDGAPRATKSRMVSFSRETEVGASGVDSRGRTESGGGGCAGEAAAWNESSSVLSCQANRALPVGAARLHGQGTGRPRRLVV